MSLFSQIKDGLRKSRESVFKRIRDALSGGDLSAAIEEVEELLILSDMGMETVESVVDTLRSRTKRSDNAVQVLKEILVEHLKEVETSETIFSELPHVISVVGVNGTGKTTTIGKLSKMYSSLGKSVVVASGDTFRAAAVEQLKHWCEQTGAEFISQGHGADAASVAFDAVNHALSKKKDLVIIDTAGRLHTRHNLMEELKKIHRVVARLIEDAPHEVLLVIDANTGQNGLMQARKFLDAVRVTGIILTKLDGTAKGGIVFAISRELGIPVKYIGIGEKLEDLRPFDPEMFVEALLSTD
ncbi:MAG TPA: signal recognition particle-docking protein FtsY [Kosmotogaceae bacterium]|nr:MAG: Signal recognition particle receptor FtsY [Thermotogales bacterium 46_20]HAA84824.1 signal recognition particle-docking protein FtsY [Kosmotogaceae bacterium]